MQPNIDLIDLLGALNDAGAKYLIGESRIKSTLSQRSTAFASTRRGSAA
jgi:hypothetical protein